MSIQIYGIPNCGTCKKTLEWFKDNEIDYEFVNIKENSPTYEMTAKWVNALGSQSMRNTSGQSYRAIGDEKKAWTDEQWAKAFAEDVMLLKRPLVVKDGTAVAVGFREGETVRKKLSLSS